MIAPAARASHSTPLAFDCAAALAVILVCPVHVSKVVVQNNIYVCQTVRLSVALEAYECSVSQQARLFLPIDTTRSDNFGCLAGLDFGVLLCIVFATISAVEQISEFYSIRQFSEVYVKDSASVPDPESCRQYELVTCSIGVTTS